MHRQRFEHGIVLLREVEREQKPFYLNFWFADENHPFDCNTAACAAGWMVRDRWMRDEGLDVSCREPGFLHYRGFHALSVFFDITFADAQDLFSPNGYDVPAHDVTAAMVANHMQRMLDRHPAEPVDVREPVFADAE